MKARAWESGCRAAVEKSVATEVPVALVYNGESLAVMMMTPLALEDFALGFSLSEGVIAAPREMLSVEARHEDRGIVLSMRIPEDRFMDVLRRRRALAGKTGCGLCGVESLEEALRPLPEIRAGLRIAPAAIYTAYDALHEQQPEKLATGAVHAAAFADAEGNIKIVREDVGRHNALDKLIGAAARQGVDPASGFILITSRCSFEMVQKTVIFGAPILAAISAPTTLAVDLAREAGLTLVALARKGSFVVFCGGRNIAGGPGQSSDSLSRQH